MPSVLSNFLNSEKGVAFLLVYLGAIGLTALGRIEPTTAQWLDNTTLWLGIYTGGKAIQGAASLISHRPAASPATTATTNTTVIGPVALETGAPPNELTTTTTKPDGT